MFELDCTPVETALVFTKRGFIVAEIGPEIEEAWKDHHRGYLREGRNREERSPPTAGYNCSGMVFASRRASILQYASVKRILDDDGYRTTEHPRVDDLVMYYFASGEWLHVGRIVRVPQIRVLSKLRDRYGEIVHDLYDYPLMPADARIEYWTDRINHAEPNPAARISI